MKKLLAILLTSLMMVSMFTACSSKPEVKEYTNEELATIVDSARSDEEKQFMAMMPIDDEMFIDTLFNKDFMGFTKENYKNGTLAISFMNVQAYAIMVMVPAEGKTEDVVAELTTYKEKMVQSFDQYLMDQYEIAQNAVVETLDNGVVVLVMCPDSQTVYENIVKGFEA